MNNILFPLLLTLLFVCPNAWPQTAPDRTRALWQTRLNVLETDFVRFLSTNRVLVGTMDDVTYLAAFKLHEIMLLDASTGAVVWAVPRASFGLPQRLVAIAPVILIDGSKQLVALNPDTGAQLWSREHTADPPLLLGAQDMIVFFDRKAVPMSLSAVNLKTGSEVWKTPLDNSSTDKNTLLDVNQAGNVVFLNGPEEAAFSAADGKLLWRVASPAGARVNAIPLGDDLYFSDGTGITRSDPASGKQIWRSPLSDGTLEALTASERNVFVLLKGSGYDPADSIAALDRASGKPLWKFDLQDRAASPMIVAGNRLYLTTPGNVTALDIQSGARVFKTEIPERLASPRQLPDLLRLAGERLIVARENGVLAVARTDGKLLFADEAVGGKGSTYDYLIHRTFPSKERADDNFRVWPVQQRSVYEQMKTFNQVQMTNQLNMVRDLSPGYALAGTAAVGGIYAAAAVGSAIEAGRRAEDTQIRLEQTFQTHANSLQEKFYMRPVYEQGQGRSLYVVNVETGEHANILLSEDNPDIKKHYMDTNLTVANLPAFSANGSRIVSRGIGENPQHLDGHRGIGLKIAVDFPSVLAFDAAALHFEQAQPLAPLAKNPLDERLLAAASKGDGETVNKMLDAGANVNARDEYGKTVLMLAAEAGARSFKSDVIKLLLDRGADVELRDAGGWRAYEYATPVANTLKGAPAQKLIEKAQNQHK